MARTVEEWRPVLGWGDLYETSDMGRVRRLSGRPLKPRIKMPGGYLLVSLSRNGTHTTRTVHSLVLEAFVGPRPKGYHGAHNNGRPGDCRLENLRWATCRDNHSDKRSHGTLPVGEAHGRAKLTAGQVIEMRRRLAAGETLSALAKDFDVAIPTVFDIKSRKNWKHLP